MECHGRLGHGDGGVVPEFRVDGEQHGQILIDGGGEWIYQVRGGPLGHVLRFGRQLDVLLPRDGAGAGDVEREGGAGFDAVGREVVGGGEAPASGGQDADSDPAGGGAGGIPHLAVLG